MKTIITGAGGQVGAELARALSLTGAGAGPAVALTRRELDVGDRAAVRAAVGALRPDAVINCAARTAVDDCEADADGAFRVNAAGAGHLAEACAAAGAHLTTISTDYVFDGRKAEPYTEDDEPGPLSVYGRSKLAGEQAAFAAAGGTVAVVRTSLVCGAQGSNSVKTVLAQLRRGGELRYVTDQVACPTFAADLAEMLLRLARRRRSGLFHVTNQGAVSRFEFARATAAAAGADPGRVLPITTAELTPPPAAARPAFSVLDNAALRAAGLPLLRHFGEPLRELVAELN